MIQGAQSSATDELTRLGDLMARHDVPYWIDSGTLLGMVRDGCVLPNDRDIDLGIWADSEELLPPLLSEFRDLGFKLATYLRQGLCFKYKLHPGTGHSLRIDINVFREAGDHAWCPATLIKKNPANRGTLAYFAQALMHLPLRRIYHRHGGAYSSGSWPWSQFVETRTWWIPSHYFRQLEQDSEFGLWTPCQRDSYLALRYGDWREPCPDWEYWTDDGGLQHCRPEELMQSTTAPGLG